jgi:prepilin-type N-terminal cleavage/methylation domain-containing protein
MKGRKERQVMSWHKKLMRVGHGRESGFTLVEVLTVAAMIAILSSMAVVSMRGGRRIAFETRAIAGLKNVAENEVIYYQRIGEYGYWNDLVDQRDLVDPGYNKQDYLDDPYDAPIANLYSLGFNLTENRQGFTVVAFPLQQRVWHLRTYAVTSDGSIMNSKDHPAFFSTLFLVPWR